MKTNSDLIFEKMPNYGEIIPIKEWINCVNDMFFTDYDGHGKFSNGKEMSNIEVYPSDITKKNKEIPEWATHVVWFNK